MLSGNFILQVLAIYSVPLVIFYVVFRAFIVDCVSKGLYYTWAAYHEEEVERFQRLVRCYWGYSIKREKELWKFLWQFSSFYTDHYYHRNNELGTSKFQPENNHILIELLRMERQEKLKREQNVSLSPVHSIPSDVMLERAQDYKMAVASKKSLLGNISQYYEMKQWSKLASAIGKGPHYVKTSEVVVGSVKGAGGVTTMSLPIINGREEEGADMRLKPSSKPEDEQIMVGAVEIVADGFASISSDVTLAAALYDKRHSTLQNSFKGAFAVRASGEPSHVVLHPAHRVPVCDDVNKTLEISLVSRDTDMDDNFTLANVSTRTIYVKTRNPRLVCETRQLLRDKANEVVKANQFIAKGNIVMAAPRLYPQVDLRNYSVPHNALLKTEGVYSSSGSICYPSSKLQSNSVVLNWEQSKPLSGRSQANEGVRVEKDIDEEEEEFQAQGLMDTEVLEAQVNMEVISNRPETMRLLASGRGNVPLNIVEGYVTTSIFFHKLKELKGVHTQFLNLLAKIPGSIKVRLNMEIPATCGIGMYITYVEGNESASLGKNAFRLMGLQKKVWNPAIEPSIDFLFKPFTCCDWWNMHYLGTGNYAPVLVIGALTTWLDPPKIAPTYSYSMYFEPDIVLPKQIYNLQDTSLVILRKNLGVVTFEQGLQQAYAFEANFGKGQISGDLIVNTMTSGFCSMGQYVNTDVCFEITSLASPMKGGTFTLAYTAGNSFIKKTTLQYMDSLPHVTFTLPKSRNSTVQVKFPRSVFGVYTPSDRWDLSVEQAGEMVGRFVLYQRDCVTTTLEGPVSMFIAMRSMGDVELVGTSAGYPNLGSRNGKGKTGKREIAEPKLPIGVKRAQGILLQPGENVHVFQPMARWKYKEAQEIGERHQREITPKQLKLRLDGTKNSEDLEILHSPIVKMLQNCAWFKGTLVWKVVIEANSEWMSYQRTSNTMAAIHENSLSSYVSHLSVSGHGSCEYEFERTIAGQIEGFKSMGWTTQGEKKFYKMEINLGNVHEYDQVTILVRQKDNTTFAGQQKAGYYRLDKAAKTFEQVAVE